VVRVDATEATAGSTRARASTATCAGEDQPRPREAMGNLRVDRDKGGEIKRARATLSIRTEVSNDGQAAANARVVSTILNPQAIR